MKITLKSLRALSPCKEGYEWCHKNFKACKNDLATVLRSLHNNGHSDWANWLIVRHMTNDQKVMYAIFSAEQVIDIFEKKYPADGRPRKEIETAKKYLKTKSSAAAAAYAAAAARSAYDAYGAYDAAVYAADAAAYAADAAYAAADAAAAAAAAYAADAADAAADAAAAYAAAYAAADAAYAAADAADAAYAAADAAAKVEMQKRILEYGISLIEKEVQ